MTVATLAASRALNDLIDTGKMLEQAARKVDGDTADYIAGTLTKLDAVRTRLVQDGADYLDEAWAFVDAGRRIIAGYGMQLAEVIHARA